MGFSLTLSLQKKVPDVPLLHFPPKKSKPEYNIWLTVAKKGRLIKSLLGALFHAIQSVIDGRIVLRNYKRLH